MAPFQVLAFNLLQTLSEDVLLQQALSYASSVVRMPLAALSRTFPTRAGMDLLGQFSSFNFTSYVIKFLQLP
jgi:hypothetical protein